MLAKEFVMPAALQDPDIEPLTPLASRPPPLVVPDLPAEVHLGCDVLAGVLRQGRRRARSVHDERRRALQRQLPLCEERLL